jgi:hypothetical protein
MKSPACFRCTNRELVADYPEEDSNLCPQPCELLCFHYTTGVG